MKKREVIVLSKTLGEAIKVEGSVKYRYGIIKNQGYLAKEIEILKKIEEEYDAILVDFNKDRNDLIMKHGQTDEQGVTRVSPEDEKKFKAFTKEFKVLQETHKDALDEFNNKLKEYQTTILEEELEDNPTLYKIDVENLPNDLPIDVLNVLMYFKIVD